MSSDRGSMIVAAGLDCSGKSTMINALKDWALENGKSTVDIRDIEKRTNSLPSFNDVKDAEVLISAEPTYAWIGDAIRSEVIRNGVKGYGARTTASLYSFDRLMLYNRILIPFIEKGGLVFQDRSVESSIVYQPVQASLNKEIRDIEDFRKFVMNLHGNRIALKIHPTDLIMVAKCPVDEAVRRKNARLDKNDNCIFENRKFQGELAKYYYSDWFVDFFENFGTKVAYVDSSVSIDETRKNTLAAWNDFIKLRKYNTYRKTFKQPFLQPFRKRLIKT